MGVEPVHLPPQASAEHAPVLTSQYVPVPAATHCALSVQWAEHCPLAQNGVLGSIHPVASAVQLVSQAAVPLALTQNSPDAHCEFTVHCAEHAPELQYGRLGSAHVAPVPHAEPHTVPLAVVMQYGEPAVVQSESAEQVATHLEL
jgi:hypothetical protein